MRIIALTVFMLFAGVAAYAATVNLTDGRVVQGDIISQDAKGLQINVDGTSMTYYADEIKDVDGKPFSGPLSSAQAEVNAQNVFVPSGTPAGIDPQKRALIMKFIDVFGTRQALINNFDTMIKQIEKEKPEEAEKIRQRVKVDEIIEHLLPIYDRNFTSEDLQAFIDFYGSPQGRKLMGTIPELMKESVQESVKYMQEKFPEVK